MNCRAYAGTCPEPVVLIVTEVGRTPRVAKGFCLRHVVGALMAYLNLMREMRRDAGLDAPDE